MALIYRDTRMSDVIAHEPSVIPVINRFGINLGTGDSSVAEICAAHNLDTDFVLAILNTFVNDGYFPEDTLLSFRVSEASCAGMWLNTFRILAWSMPSAYFRMSSL